MEIVNDPTQQKGHRYSGTHKYNWNSQQAKWSRKSPPRLVSMDLVMYTRYENE